MSSQLSLEGLLAASPAFNNQDLVQKACRHLFLSHVRSQPNVQEIFFPNHIADKYEDRIDHQWFDFETFASIYVCQGICKYKDEYKIHSMLNSDKVDDTMGEFYGGPDWKKIGFALYTMLFADLVRDPTTALPFRMYMENSRQEWAQKLVAKVKDPKWVYNEVMQPVIRGSYSGHQYNRDMNTLFIKLHLLDPTTVMPTYQHLRKVLPDLNLELATTNYLGDPLEWTLIKPDIELAMTKATYPKNASKLSMETMELYYGVQVTEYIMHDAREMGLWTGKYPDNKRISSVRDRCDIMDYCCIM